MDSGDVGYPLKGFAAYTNTADPIEGMKIEVFVIGHKEPMAVTTTDSNGNFYFPHLQEGKYKLKSRKPGWSTNAVHIRVTRNSKDFIDICTEYIGPPGVVTCYTLVDQIDKKLRAKGVEGYVLELLDKDTVTKGKVVGICEHGTRKIVYTRQEAKMKELGSIGKTSARSFLPISESPPSNNR